MAKKKEQEELRCLFCGHDTLEFLKVVKNKWGQYLPSTVIECPLCGCVQKISDMRMSKGITPIAELTWLGF
jgi:uncharacterized Zn finger protein